MQATSQHYGVPDVLDNVHHVRVFNTSQLLDMVNVASTKMMETHFALLVIDCAPSLYRLYVQLVILLDLLFKLFILFRVDYPGRKELYNRQTHMNSFLRTPKRIADVVSITFIFNSHFKYW